MQRKRIKTGLKLTAGRDVRISIRNQGVAGLARKAMLPLFACVLAGVLAPCAYSAQNQRKQHQMEFLVARNQIKDPYFRHSVVFMLPARNGPLIVGLIINRPTRVTLNRLFPDTPEFKNQTEPAFFGGPVDIRTPSVVFRSDTVPKRAVKLYGNVYLTFDHDLIIRLFRNSLETTTPRMFLGRAQWAPGQLQNEIHMGGWYRIHADGDLIFTSHPGDIWRTLHTRAAPSKYIRYQAPSGGHPQSAKEVSGM